MIVIPDTGGLVEAAYPDYGVARELPAELEPFQVTLVIGQEIFAEELERAFLQAEQRVGLEDLVVELGLRGLPVEGAHRRRTGQQQELALQRVGSGPTRAKHRQHDQQPRNAHASPL